MKSIFTMISLLLLAACTSSPDSSNEIDISGRWTECREIAPFQIAFTEVIYSDNNSKVERATFGGLDHECEHTVPEPAYTSEANLILDNPHLTASGLMVYDYSLLNVTRWDKDSNTTTPQPDFYSILYLEGDKLHFGKITSALDGSSPAKRPDEIEHSFFVTRQ